MPTDSLSRLGLTPESAGRLQGQVRGRLIDFLLRWEEYGNALACLEEMIPLNPGLVSLLDDRARALVGLGRADEALAVMRTREALKSSITARAQEARIHLARGDTEAALAIAQELLSAKEDNVIAWGLVGEVRLARKEWAGALAAYTRLNALSPEGRSYLVGMLALHQAQGDQVTASAYAVRLQQSALEGQSLPATLLRRLRDYYRTSGEPHRVADAEAALAALYEQELAALEAALQQERPARAGQPEEAAPAASRPDVGAPATPEEQPLPTLQDFGITPVERERVERAARELFGFERLLPGQVETIALVLRGEDVLTILPTGGGKSLCYQLPAFMDTSGLTLVISPLIALMKDQVDSLPNALRPRATTINSSLDGDELRRRLQQVAAGGYRLVYAAPERLRQMPFLHALRRAGLNRLVIDEAHCVSLWGHDFRPDYLYIGRAREILGDLPVLAMTATAPPRVRRDIIRRIGRASAPGKEPEMALVATPPLRPNLYLQVVKVKNADEKLAQLIALCQAEAGSGIVYVNAREKAERLAQLLRDYGISAGHYHAGMGDGAARAEAQDAFMSEKVRVMVATIAFGMGIDKPDIRFILHYDLANSLESYYQEAGRGGRDGLPARCVILYAPSDRSTLTLRANRDRLSVELLRAVYAAARRRLSGEKLGSLALGDLARDVEREETAVRVALSLLEEVGLLRRHQDTPRTAMVTLLPRKAGNAPLGEERLEAFSRAARLRPGEALALDLLQVARAAGLDPLAIEDDLLTWADGGWLAYRSIGRDLLLELVSPPKDAAMQVEALLDRYATLQVQRIDEVVAYAKARRCRHGHISAYLTGQAPRHCEACDNCVPSRAQAVAAAPGVLPDEGEQIRLILRCLAEAKWGWGKRHLIQILRGEPDAPEQDRQSCAWGKLAFRSVTAVGSLLDRLLAARLLSSRQLDHGGVVLELTKAGWEALAGPVTPPSPPPSPGVPGEGAGGRGASARQRSPAAPGEGVGGGAASARQCSPTVPGEGREDRPSLAGQRSPSPGTPGEGRGEGQDAGGAASSPPDEALFARLRVWRRQVAEEAAVPPFIVAHDTLLQRIATVQPHTEAELSCIKGMGPKKLGQYGAAILALVNGSPLAEDTSLATPLIP